MITLYGSTPAFGLPEASPFVAKARILLIMSGVPFELAKGDFNKAPKGKIPYIDDDGQRLGDSTFIRWHLETKYGTDFDRGLTSEQKATAWAFEKMCDEHLYWAIVNARWMDPVNFEKGPKIFFKDAPALLRPAIVAMVRKRVRATLKGQGLGRHSDPEIVKLATADLKALSDKLGDKPWLFGDAPCSADAAAWSIVASCLCKHFDSPLRTAAEGFANLAAYRARYPG